MSGGPACKCHAIWRTKAKYVDKLLLTSTLMAAVRSRPSLMRPERII